MDLIFEQLKTIDRLTRTKRIAVRTENTEYEAVIWPAEYFKGTEIWFREKPEPIDPDAPIDMSEVPF